MNNLITKENPMFKSRTLLCYLLVVIYVISLLLLPEISFAEVISSTEFSYVADFKGKAVDEGTKELVGFVNASEDCNSHLLYLNSRTANTCEKTTCTYYEDGDYIDANGNELHFKPDDPAIFDVTIGFRINMGEKILTSGTKYSSMSVSHGVRRDIDNDSVAEEFLVNDSLTARQQLFRNYHQSNLIRFYSYVDGVSSYKEVPVLNTSWNDIKIEADFIDSDSDILYEIRTYCNNTLYGIIEIPKIITVSSAVNVQGSTGDTVTIKGETEISGLYNLNLLTSNDTLVKDVYIHSGLSKIQNSLVAVNEKTDFLDKVIVTEQFTDTKLDETLNISNFNVATKSVSGGYMTLSYTGDGSKTAKDMLESPYVQVCDTQNADKYIFRVRCKFNDFKVERIIAQMFSGDSETEVSHAPILKTAKGSTMRKSKLLFTYNNGVSNIEKSVDIANDTWYDIEITTDLTDIYPIYSINVIDESQVVILNENGIVDKTSGLLTDTIHWQIKMNNTLEEINALSETTKMYLDDIYFSSIQRVEKLQVNDVKIFDGCKSVDVAAYQSLGENLKISALVSNYATSPVSGRIFVCQYTGGDELISINQGIFNISGAYDPYLIDCLPTSDAVTVSIKLDSETSWVKIFVMDSLDSLTPYTKIFELAV